MCDSLPAISLVPGQSCNCSDSWLHEVVEDFEWQNTSYRYLEFTPAENLVATVPTYEMTLQAFYDCRSSMTIAHNAGD